MSKNKKKVILLFLIVFLLQIIYLSFSYNKNNIKEIKGLLSLKLLFFFCASTFFFYLIINNLTFHKLLFFLFIFDLISLSFIFFIGFIPFLEKFFYLDIYIKNYFFYFCFFNINILFSYFLFRFFSEENYKKSFNAIKPLLDIYEEEYSYMFEYYKQEEKKLNEIEKHSKSLIEIFDLAGDLQKEFLIENFMQKIISKINNIIEFEKGLFVIFSFEKNDIEIEKKYYFKCDENYYANIPLPFILSNILIYKKIIFFNHSFSNISLDLLPNYNILLLPLIVQKKILGFFLVERLKKINYDNLYFNEDDIYKLKILILQIAINLHKCLLYEKLQKLVIYDSLTGLLVHNRIKQNLVKEINRSKNYNLPLSLLMCDIDFFKKFNDNYGHETGDEVLKAVANTLLDSLRESDYVGRYGGEEFMIILSEANKNNAKNIAERIRTNIEKKTFFYKNNGLKITISIGIASFPEDGENAEELIKAADVALYKAKKKGRNRVEIYFSGEKDNE